MSNHKQSGAVEIILLGIVVVALLGFFALNRLRAHRSTTAETTNTSPSIAQPSDDSSVTIIPLNKANDTIKIERLETLGLSLSVYEATWLKNGRVEESAKDWNMFRDHLINRNSKCASILVSMPCKEALTDPYTGTMYEFTDQLPDFGEVQYKFPMACDSPNRDGKEFEQGSRAAHAMKVKISTGYYCHLLTF